MGGGGGGGAPADAARFDVGPSGGRDGGGGGGGEPGDATPPDGGDALPPDAAVCDCPGDQTCAEGTAECIEADPCAADLDCFVEQNRICGEDSKCADGCDADLDCEDPELPRCFSGRCGQCGEDLDCPAQQTCSDDRRCEEANPCSSSFDCIGDRICDSETDECVDPVQGGCHSADDCEGGEYCEPVSQQCVREVCEDSNDCGADQVCLTDARPVRCGRCQTDDHCQGEQVCARSPEGNVCEEPPDCVADIDCLGDRVCDDGACVAPPCDDDVFEPNDDAASATELVAGQAVRNLTSCDRNPDWYRFVLPARNVATVSVRLASRQERLRVVALDADGAELTRSDSGLPVETVQVRDSVEQRVIFLRIEQPGAPSEVGYQIDIRLVPADAGCVDDARDTVPPGDDERATATSLRVQGEPTLSRRVEARICPDDLDWYCFYLATRERANVSITRLSGSPTIVAELLDRGDAVVGAGHWGREGQEDEDISFQGAPGTYCLRVFAEARSGEYVLDIGAFSGDQQAMCRAPGEVPLDAQGRGAVDGALPVDEETPSNFQPTCAPAAGASGEAIWRVSISEPRLLVARVTGTGDGTLGDPVVSVRGECLIAATEFACNDDRPDPDAPVLVRSNPAEVRVPVVPEGPGPQDFFIFVDGVDAGENPEYRLEVQTRSLAVPPRNDRCDQATPIELVDGVAELSVNLDRASDDESGGCLGAGGPDASYGLRLDRPSRVHVQVAAVPAEFAVGAYLLRRCGDPASAMGCGYGFSTVEPVPAGNYTLAVDGAGPQSRGRVSVQVVVESAGDPPANDTCDDAEELDPAGGELDGDTRRATDDYPLPENNRCTGHNSRAPDVAYTLVLPAGEQYVVEAEPIGGWDLSLAVVRDCADPAGSCVDGHDGALTERVVLNVAQGGEVFVIVDGSSGEAGPFRLRWGPAACVEDEQCGDGQRCVDLVCEGP